MESDRSESLEAPTAVVDTRLDTAELRRRIAQADRALNLEQTQSNQYAKQGKWQCDSVEQQHHAAKPKLVNPPEAPTGPCGAGWGGGDMLSATTTPAMTAIVMTVTTIHRSQARDSTSGQATRDTKMATPTPADPATTAWREIRVRV